jgi:hypothetical protein
MLSVYQLFSQWQNKALNQATAMHEEQEQIGKILLHIVIGEQLKESEQEVLDKWIAKSPHNKTVYKEITDPGSLEKKLAAIRGYDRELLWNRIRNAIRRHSAKVVW